MKALLFILMFAASGVVAQTGSITGLVTDLRTGEALPGANVLVQGTLRGAATNIDGKYTITGVAPGTYTLTFTLVGYSREVRPGVAVTDGGVTTLDAQLSAIAIATEPVIVTASKREQSVQEVPASVSVLDAASIAYRNALTVDDALRYIPGVNMTEFQVNVRGSSGYSRGAGSRVLMLVDGIPLLTGDTGELNFESIPTGQIDRIEVVKGAASALYGSSALGGVINVITRRVPEDPETRVRTYGGMYSEPSFKQWDWSSSARMLGGVSASHSRHIGPVGFSVYGSRISDDGFRRNDYKRRTNLAFRSDVSLSPDDVLTASFSFLDQRRGSFLYWRDATRALEPPEEQLSETVHSTRFYATSIYTHTISPDALIISRALWYRNKFTDTIGGRVDVSRSDVLRGEVQFSWTPTDRHILAFGVEGNYDRVRADLFGKHTGTGGAAYVQDEIRLSDEFRLTFGARFDIQSLGALETNSQFNPKAALVYLPTPGTSLRASVGRGFRSPTVAEAFTSTSVAGFLIVPNPALKPERSVSYEIGGNQLLGETAAVDLAIFRNDFSNLIETGFNARGEGQFSNVTEARITGMELTSQLNFLNRGLFINVGYTYVYPEDLTRKDILKYRPRHVLQFSTHGHLGLFTLGADFRYLSKLESIDQEFVTLGIIRNGDLLVPIRVVDLRVGADLSHIGLPLNATFNVNNLLQYNYVELIGNLAAPRTMILTLEARF